MAGLLKLEVLETNPLVIAPVTVELEALNNDVEEETELEEPGAVDLVTMPLEDEIQMTDMEEVVAGVLVIVDCPNALAVDILGHTDLRFISPMWFKWINHSRAGPCRLHHRCRRHASVTRS